MREEELRAVLLIKSIEELDRDGTLIAPADRLDAARQAKRSGEGADPLAHRAKTLLEKVVVRHPFVQQVFDFAGGAPWIGWLAIAGALTVGLALSALDGTRRINVLAFPLLGLVLWNLLAYGAVIAAWIGSFRKEGPRGQWLASLASHAAIGRVSALIARSRTFDAPLAEALARFLRDWQDAARPLILARATRVLHLAAAAVGIGLLAGLYLRGIAFDYRAGWESTFLDAAGAHALLSIVYGPASWLTGIAIPDVSHLEAIRWRDGGGGEPAGRWIHLLAASAALFVVLPRLALALLATAFIARGSRNPIVPPSLAAYSRIAFSGVGGLVDRGIVTVVACAYQPSTNSLALLRTVLGGEMGEHLAVDLRPPVRYGEEEAFLQNVATHGAEWAADVIVLLFSLATTPEDENHGLLMTGVRDWIAQKRPRAQLVVMVDEGPYRARMQGAGERLEVRRRAWKEFIGARGLEPRFVDLAP